MMKTRAQRFTERTSAVLARRVGRRGFIVRAAIAGSAMMVDPLRYLLRPGSAYAAVCGPGADCASGWTVMCCSINRGINQCPPGSIPAGWWKADNSGFCGGGPRYYIDCNASCGACGCDTSGVCAPNCQNCTARCNTGTCDQRRVCWNQFRYGQCHQEIRCVGAVVCRQVSCTPPWQVDPTCSQLALTNNATALHDAPCLHQPGAVFAFGHAPFEGAPAFTLNAPLVGIAATPSGTGYWLVASDGGIFNYGDARFFGSMGNQHLNEPIVDIAATPTGKGYWLVASDGGIFSFGDARFFGSMGDKHLNQPIVGIDATPTGKGYWLVASDGGIFSFGDARFHGSTGDIHLNQPVVGLAATPTANGYWLVASDGGIFSFGDARFHGSLARYPLSAPVTAIARTPTGNGYWMLGIDGHVYALGDAHYYGNAALGSTSHAADIARRPTGDGYWVTADITPAG